LRVSHFEARIAWLRKNKFDILTLQEAMAAHASRSLRRRSVVISFDEGFKNYLTHALPVLNKYDVTATVFVTTYHVIKQTPVFRLALQYLIWKFQPQYHLLESAYPQIVSQLTKAPHNKIDWDLIRYCETDMNEDERLAFLKYLSGMCDPQSDPAHSIDHFCLMSPDEIQAAADKGTDIQLHTHRHKPKVNLPHIERELADNKAVLEKLKLPNPLTHLAYPSGVWSRALLDQLHKTGLESAATCIPGPNTYDTSRYALRRFVDCSDVFDWEFRAEVLGFAHLLRAVAGRNNDQLGHAASDDDIPKDLQT
jgi:peptidoglycan/xylan/chitin deacetylase (PgdA/CDA1 family)